jgi:hypothetical protein
MPTPKNQLPTLTVSTVQKYLTVNRVGDQLDSSSLFLSYEIITSTPATPVTNKAYLLNFGAGTGKIRYYYLNSATAALVPVDIPANIGDKIGVFVRAATTWVYDVIPVAAAATLNSSTLVDGFNRVAAAGSFNFSFTGTVYSSLAAANPLPLPAGLIDIYKEGSNYYVNR